MAECSKVQLVMAVLSASVVAAVVFGVGYGVGSTTTSKRYDRIVDFIDDTSPPAVM